MVIKIFFLVSFCFFSCSQEKKSRVYEIKLISKNTPVKTLTDAASSGLSFQPTNSYWDEKVKVNQVRLRLKRQYLLLKSHASKSSFLDSVSIVFTDLLLNNIVPHWYGTPWDFNGYTSVPNQGEIACGYFVSTTLRHMGLNLNRYHLAKQNPLNEAKSLAIDTNFVLTFNSDTQLIKNELFSSFPDGLYFIGLDSHVGYLYLYKEQAFFIHSNYIENRVMLEPIEKSEAFISRSYFLVKITSHKSLMKKWILDDKIFIYK
jgi:hypothetical protein